MKFICSKCGHEEDFRTQKPKCHCGGLWKLNFKPKIFDESLIDRDTWNIFRYREFMPLIDDFSWRNVTLGEGFTPIIRFNDDIWLKMDYFMPTLSFKDRGAAILVAHCNSIGVKSVVQDSSGNAGNSIAAYCGKIGIECEIFVPEGTSDKKIRMIESHGAKINVVSGNRDHCAKICREKVAREEIFYANHVYNPIFYEGTKTFIYETYEQLHRVPKNIFVPLGNGTLFIGVMKGLEHLLESGLIDEFPQVFVVQSENCQPFVRAIEQKSKNIVVEEPKFTLAEGIAIGEPSRAEEILEFVYKHGVKAVKIPENMILTARNELSRRGIYCEHTTAGVYAGYLHFCELNGKISDVLISMCGAGLKSDH